MALLGLPYLLNAFLCVQVAKEDYNLGFERERLMQRRQESSLGEKGSQVKGHSADCWLPVRVRNCIRQKSLCLVL